MELVKIASIIMIMIIICVSILYIYNNETNIEKCEVLHTKFEILQNELNASQNNFENQIKMFKHNSLNKEKIMQDLQKHNKNLEGLMAKYNDLKAPSDLMNSVNLFKLSLVAQYESNYWMIKWVHTNNQSDLIRSDYLLQNSFEYESGALSMYNSKIIHCN